jgi:hypothetical protein
VLDCAGPTAGRTNAFSRILRRSNINVGNNYNGAFTRGGFGARATNTAGGSSNHHHLVSKSTITRRHGSATTSQCDLLFLRHG